MKMAWLVLHGVRTFTSSAGTAAVEEGREITVRVGAIIYFQEMLDWPGHTRILVNDGMGLDVWEAVDFVRRCLLSLDGLVIEKAGEEGKDHA